MEIRNTQWRKHSKETEQNARILAGGDGSRKVRSGETQLQHMGGEFMESENTRWNTEKNTQHSDVRIMASGGNMDWAPENARSNRHYAHESQI